MANWWQLLIHEINFAPIYGINAPLHLTANPCFMKRYLFVAVLLVSSISLLAYWYNGKNNGLFPISKDSTTNDRVPNFNPSIKTIAEIPLPTGFERVTKTQGSMAAWLGQIHLKKDKTIYLYNKKPSTHQTWPYAVLDVSVNGDGLQQCADAVMRLRSEYLFAEKNYRAISFPYANGTFNFASNTSSCYTHDCLMKYLKNVFISCGTYTVEQVTKQVRDFSALEAGNVLVKAGSPGHAMMVADVAVNPATKEKIYLLIQSYMPSEDIHVVMNPSNAQLGPWFKVDTGKDIRTPGYHFEKKHLRKW